MAAGGPRKRIYSSAANMTLGGAGGPAAPPTVEVVGNPGFEDVQLAPAFTTEDFIADLAAAQLAPAWTALDFEADIAAAQLAPAFTAMDFFQTDLAAAQLKIGSYTMRVGQVNQIGDGLRVSKDTWAPETAGCVDNTNKNGTRLDVEGTTALKKNAFLGWSVVGFPSNATVIGGTIALQIEAAPGTLAQTIVVEGILNSAEGWSETTLTCSNQPADQAAEGSSMSIPTGSIGNIAASSLNATGQSRLAARMGTGTYSVTLQNNSAVGDLVGFADKDAFLIPAALNFEFRVDL